MMESEKRIRRRELADEDISEKLMTLKQKLEPKEGEQYRETTLGVALISALNEMIENGKMTNNLANKILIHFDVHMEAQLKRCGTRVTIKTDRMTDYKEFRSNYFFKFETVEIAGKGRCGNFNVNVDKVRVRAVASKTVLLQQQKKKQNKKGNGSQGSRSRTATQNN